MWLAVSLILGILSSEFVEPHSIRPQVQPSARHELVITAPVEFRRAGLRVAAEFMDSGRPTVLNIYGHYPELRSGDVVALRGRLLPVAGYRNPGAPDPIRQAQRQGIDRVVRVTRFEDIHITGQAAGWWLLRPLETLRYRIRDFLIDKIPLGPPLAKGDVTVSTSVPPFMKGGVGGISLLRALLIGDRSGLDEATTAAFRDAGLAHLLAISGQHIGMLALLSYGLLRLLLCGVPRLALWVPLQQVAWGLAWFPTALYVGIAGAPLSARRALILFSVFVLAFLLKRRRELWSALALAALIILAWDPSSLFTISFQLSFMAVAALLACSGPQGAGFKNWLVRLVTASAIVTLITAPVVSYYFQSVPIAGLIANLIAIPLVGFVVLPLASLSVLGGSFVFPCADWAAERLINIAEFFAAWDLSLPLALRPAQVWICYGAILIGVVLWRCWIFSPPYKGGDSGEVKKDPTLTLPFVRGGKIAGAALIFGTVVLLGVIHFDTHSRDRLQLTMLDVGQGDAIHLRFPNGTHFLVDGGGFYIPRDKRKFPVSDVGTRVVLPYLQRQGVKELAGMILSHPHPDHYEGLIAVARHLRVHDFYWSGDRFPDSSFNELLDLLRAQGTRFHRVAAGASPLRQGEVDIQWLNPRARGRENLNNRSLVMRLDYRNICFILTGDIEAATERRLARQRDVDCDILKVPHHGSRTSSLPEFLAAVSPDWALVSAGARNPFRHPHSQVMARYEQQGIQVLRTDQHGAIIVTTDGGKIDITAVASSENRLADQHRLQSRSRGRVRS